MNELMALLASDEWADGAPGRDLGWYDVATLDLASGELWVGDPGFSWAELSSDDGTRVALEPGAYKVQAFIMAFGSGHFVARLRVCSGAAAGPTLGPEIGEAGTDTAAIGVCDARLVLEAFQSRFGDDADAAVLFLENFDFKRAGVLYPRGNEGPPLVYVNSGFGDGGGPVFELLEHGRRVGIELPFIEPGATA